MGVHVDVRVPPLVPMKMDVADFFLVVMVEALVVVRVTVSVIMAVMMVTTLVPQRP